jgi:hypothetical protein
MEDQSQTFFHIHFKIRDNVATNLRIIANDESEMLWPILFLRIRAETRA